MHAPNSRVMSRSHSKNNRSTPVNSRNNGNGNNVTPSISNGIQSASFSGPMPPPSILEGYERIVPGAAERILAMAESDMQHQQQYDNALLKASVNQIRRGQILGFLIGLATISASVYFATIGYPILAGILSGSTLLGLVSVFAIGRIVESKE